MNNLFLSDTELYYSQSVNADTELIVIDNEECNHILNVMRHKVNDEIYVTNGKGTIFQAQIINAAEKFAECKILKQFNYEQRFPNMTFCIPMLRSSDRFEFAIEKCTELGITNFIFYHAKRSIKKKFNQKRIEKILISAMKQTLLSWLPKVEYAKSAKEISSLPGREIVFDQKSKDYFSRNRIKSNTSYLLLFGPEGGLTEDEMDLLSDAERYCLAENRLRTETAIIKAASLL